ncbi:hypothetical protein CCYA_CCYA03G0803 [Cyanidiococcus yangmingshanensis]|nr:hypothetical protein CCYA_CCYA03G0803 [Cyanidiococcus yangmingshanensis]
MSFIRVYARDRGPRSAESFGSGVTRSPTEQWPVTRLGLTRCQRGRDAAYDIALPLGTVIALIEDEPTQNARTFLRTFVAEGLLHEHVLGLLPGSLVEQLPASVAADTRSAVSPSTSDSSSATNLRIAWRYAGKERSARSQRPSKPRLDLSLCANPQEILRSSASLRLLNSLDGALDFASSRSAPQCRRLAIQSLHQWILSSVAANTSNEELFNHLWRYLHYLRNACRKSMAVTLVTLSRECCVIPSLLHILDSVIDVNTFRGRGVSELGFGAFDGLIHVVKMPHIATSLCPLHPLVVDDGAGSASTTDLLVFRRTRRELVIEPAHEAPESSIPGSGPTRARQKPEDAQDTQGPSLASSALTTDW